MKVNKAHCLFEQSGTFKGEFIKLGIPAEDYDIQNEFGQTDHVIDLYNEIRCGYEGKPSIFDNISEDDLVMAFFPCTRFEDQILLSFRGDGANCKKMSTIDKLEQDIILHKELSQNYELITKLSIISLKKKFKMVFENPYSTQHYLQRYWCLKPSIIDTDRTERGDYFKKPTQYWFYNFEPENNIIFEPMNMNAVGSLWGRNRGQKAALTGTNNQTIARSMIHPDYANRFIREFILDLQEP